MMWLQLISIWVLLHTVYSQCAYEYNVTNKTLIYSCENVTKSNYLYYMNLLNPQIQKEVGSASSLDIAINFVNSKFPELGNWITLPMSEDRSFWSKSKIFFNFSDCGVNSVDEDTFEFSTSCYLYPALDLSFNNISNVDFLLSRKASDLEELYLKNSTNSFSIFKKMLGRNYCNRVPSFIDLSYTSIEIVDLMGTDCSPEINLSFSSVKSVTIGSKIVTKIGSTTHLKMNLTKCENLQYISNTRQTNSFDFDYLDLSNIENFRKFSMELIRINEFLNLSYTKVWSLDTNFDLASIMFNRPILDISHANLQSITPEYFYGIQLKGLNLTGNNLTSLPRQLFQGAFINLLDLSNNNIKYMDSPFGSAKIGELILSHNNITTLQNVFNKTNVTSLDLSFNPIQAIDSSIFESLRGPSTLNLAGTHISTIADSTFESVTSLKSLKISINGDFNPRALASMYLKSLEITDSSIATLKDGNFYGLFNLEELIFSNSEIQNVSRGALKYLVNIKTLNSPSIFENVRVIPKGFFEDLVSMTYLDLSTIQFEGFEVGAFDGLRDLDVLNVTGSSLENDFKTIAGLVIP